MKTLSVALPDRVAEQLKELVEQGWFLDEAELARQALSEFLNKQRFELCTPPESSTSVSMPSTKL